MWLCHRHSSGRQKRADIPEVLLSALVRWYSGVGDDADHRASVMLVVTARDNHQWLACGCLGTDTGTTPGGAAGCREVHFGSSGTV